jgi:hypothetical protein
LVRPRLCFPCTRDRLDEDRAAAAPRGDAALARRFGSPSGQEIQPKTRRKSNDGTMPLLVRPVNATGQAKA